MFAFPLLGDLTFIDLFERCGRHSLQYPFPDIRIFLDFLDTLENAVYFIWIGHFCKNTVEGFLIDATTPWQSWQQKGILILILFLPDKSLTAGYTDAEGNQHEVQLPSDS